MANDGWGKTQGFYPTALVRHPKRKASNRNRKPVPTPMLIDVMRARPARSQVRNTAAETAATIAYSSLGSKTLGVPPLSTSRREPPPTATGPSETIRHRRERAKKLSSVTMGSLSIGSRAGEENVRVCGRSDYTNQCPWTDLDEPYIKDSLKDRRERVLSIQSSRKSFTENHLRLFEASCRGGK